jgi:hypothetical protein
MRSIVMCALKTPAIGSCIGLWIGHIKIIPLYSKLVDAVLLSK